MAVSHPTHLSSTHFSHALPPLPTQLCHQDLVRVYTSPHLTSHLASFPHTHHAAAQPSSPSPPSAHSVLTLHLSNFVITQVITK